MRGRKNRFSADFGAVYLLSLTAAVASVPLMTDYVLTGTGLQAALSRIEAVRQGAGRVFPVRILPWLSLEYGYSAAVFQADVFTLVPVLFRFLGFGLGASYKLTLFLANLATAAAAFRCFGKCFGRRDIGLAGSMLYTWCPYRLNEMYLGADLGNIAAWIFLPPVLSGIAGIYTVEGEKERDRLWVTLAWGFGLLAVSSTPILFVAAGASVLVFLFMGRKSWRKGTLLILGKAAGAVLLCDAWFLLPMMSRWREREMVELLAPKDIGSQGLYLAQYLRVFLWGGESVSFSENMAGAQAMCPGIVAVALVFLYLWALFVGRCRAENVWNGFGKKLLWVSLALMFLSSNSFPWELLQGKNRLFSALLGLQQTPAVWGVPACACLILLACICLGQVAEEAGGKSYKIVFLASVAASFGTAQFLLGNLLQTRAGIKPDEGMELIPFQILQGESMGWRLCGIISAVAICGFAMYGLAQRNMTLKRCVAAHGQGRLISVRLRKFMGKRKNGR